MRHKRLPPTTIDGRPAANAPRPLPASGVTPPAGGSWRTARPVVITPAPPGRRRAALCHRASSGHFAGMQRAPGFQHPQRRPQIRDLGGQPPHPELILIFDRAGDRPRPPRRRHRGHRLLTLGPPPAWPYVQHTAANPLGQLAAIHRPQVLADLGQRRRLASPTCSRVRTRTPAGGAATTGSPMRRNCALSHVHILAATTDNPPPAAALTSRSITHFRSRFGSHLLPPAWLPRNGPRATGRFQARLLLKDSAPERYRRPGRRAPW